LHSYTIRCLNAQTLAALANQPRCILLNKRK